MDETIVLLAFAVIIILWLVTMVGLIRITRQIKNLNIGELPQVSKKIIPKIVQPTVVSSMPPIPIPPIEEPPAPSAPPTEPQPENAPDPEPEPIFKCKKCGKELADKKKLQRHIGMAHYQDLDV